MELACFCLPLPPDLLHEHSAGQQGTIVAQYTSLFTVSFIPVGKGRLTADSSLYSSTSCNNFRSKAMKNLKFQRRLSN